MIKGILQSQNFKDDSEFQSEFHNLFKEETSEALDYLIFTIEDIFEVDALLKKNLSESGKGKFNVIKEGVSKELDYKRHQLRALDDLLEDVNQSIEEKLSFEPKIVFKHFGTFNFTVLSLQFRLKFTKFSYLIIWF